MSTMLIEPYDALKEAGASEAKARAAAASLILSHDRLERIEAHTDRLPAMQAGIDRLPAMQAGIDRLPAMQAGIDQAREDIARLDKDLAVVKAQIELLKWMNGIVIAGVMALIIKTFFA